MDFEKKKKNDPSLKEWFERAREKVESFLSNLDQQLQVEVKTVRISPREGEERESLVLNFTHKIDPDFRWTMDIEPNNEYIENDLEGIVRKIYMEKSMREEPLS